MQRPTNGYPKTNSSTGITSRESTAALTRSSLDCSDSSYGSEYYNNIETDNTDNLSENHYSVDDMFFKKKKNTKGSEAQKYLLVSIKVQ